MNRRQDGRRAVPRPLTGFVPTMQHTKFAGPRRVGHFEAVRTGEAGISAMEGGMPADEESWMCSD